MTRTSLHWIGLVALPVVTLGLTWALQRDFSKPNYVYFPDMAASPAYHAQEPNPVLAAGTMQLPPPGTLARGQRLFPYDSSAVDRERAARELENPFAAGEVNLARGQHLFETFCTPCHGNSGAGDGPLIPKYPNPPSFKTAQVRALADGEIFHILTFGKRKMPAHAAQISPDDRWKLILYVNQLRFGEAGQ